MSGSLRHERTKSKAAGLNGEIETPLPRGHLDALSRSGRATEIERSHTGLGLVAAACRHLCNRS